MEPVTERASSRDTPRFRHTFAIRPTGHSGQAEAPRRRSASPVPCEKRGQTPVNGNESLEGGTTYAAAQEDGALSFERDGYRRETILRFSGSRPSSTGAGRSSSLGPRDPRDHALRVRSGRPRQRLLAVAPDRLLATQGLMRIFPGAVINQGAEYETRVSWPSVTGTSRAAGPRCFPR